MISKSGRNRINKGFPQQFPKIPQDNKKKNPLK